MAVVQLNQGTDRGISESCDREYDAWTQCNMSRITQLSGLSADSSHVVLLRDVATDIKVRTPRSGLVALEPPSLKQGKKKIASFRWLKYCLNEMDVQGERTQGT